LIHETNPIHDAPQDTAHHPSAKTYIWIAVWLTIITAVEVLIYYIPPLRPVLVPLLVVLALGKFVLVVGYYMHLKFDPKMFTWLFVGGLVTAVATLTGLWALFNGWGG
jgi:cytochrome c oxidase subunit 4